MTDPNMKNAFESMVKNQEAALGHELTIDERVICSTFWFDGCNYGITETRKYADECIAKLREIDARPIGWINELKKIAGIK
jgi:hypothetical protein